jgi:ACR3 family arsenite efflux pump ArsB
MAWSHIQLFYHATKDSRVGTASSYSSKWYPSFRVPTISKLEISVLHFCLIKLFRFKLKKIVGYEFMCMKIY